MSKALHAAVVAATDHLRVALRDTRKHKQQRNQERAQSLEAYLQHYGSQHLTRLVFDRHLPSPLTLRVGLASKLEHLQVRGTLRKGLPLLQLVGGSTGEGAEQQGVLDACSRLTRLSLHACSIHGVSPSPPFTHMTALVDLRLADVWLNGAPASLSAIVLASSLPHLTHLYLSGVDVEDVQHVSALTNLRILDFRELYTRTQPAGTPATLLAPIAPGLPALPSSLQDVMLVGSISITPAVLSGVLSLTQLVLDDMAVQGDGSVLLSAVSRLQHLVVLDLQQLRDVVWPPASAEYAALTASPKLRKLLVVHAGLPHGVWVHVFAPERVSGLKFVVVDERFPLGLEAVSHLVRCCPLVKDLCLFLCAQAIAALSSLTGLKRLTLVTSGAAKDVASMHSIAMLTNLSSLVCHMYITDAGAADAAALKSTCLLPLTALKRLSHCTVTTAPHFDWCCTLTNKVIGGTQLVCAGCNVCANVAGAAGTRSQNVC